SYTFDIDQSDDQFKAVLAWSDEAASTWSSTQLVNNLNLEVTDPNGLKYLGNDFANGYSTTGGNADSLNNVEVVLIDSAIVGTWTVEVIDVNHGGSRSQPFSLAVMGHGINDLKPDLVAADDGFSIDIAIPSVGQMTELTCVVENTGNIRSDSFDVTLEVDGVTIDTQSMELSGGSQRTLVWSWTPQSAGANTVSFIIDKSDSIIETLENNNRQDVIVNVSQPGVAITSQQRIQQLTDAEQTSTTWQVSLQNTGLLSTNASIAESTLTYVEAAEELNWYVGLSGSQYQLVGSESVSLTVTVVHPESPAPGTYRLSLIATDIDNAISAALDLDLVVSEIPKIGIESDYEVIPVSPIEPSFIPVYLFNYGNTELAYDLQVQPPNGWEAYFIQDFTESPFATSSTIAVDSFDTLQVVIKPPSVVPNSGLQTSLIVSVNSVTDPVVNWLIEMPIEVEAVKSVEIKTDTSLVNLLPNSEFVAVFSIENKGNLEVKLSPTFSLPQGVQVINSGGTVELGVGQSELYLVTFQLSKSAKTGPAILHMDNGSDRFTWSDNFDVKIFPIPNIQFERVIFPGDMEYTASFYGTGSHPAGSELRFVWQLSNEAEIDWQPMVTALSDPQLSVTCDTPAMIGYQQSTELSCTVFTSSEAVPFTEPSFVLRFSGSGADYSETFSLYIGGTEEVSWSGLSSNSFKQGEPKEVQLLVTNTGTLPFNHLISVSSDQNWEIEVVGDGIVDLAVGESRTVKLLIKPNSAGVSEVSLTFSGADAAESATFVFNANAEKQESQSAAFGLPASQIGLIALLLLLLLGAFVALTRSKQELSSMPFVPSQVNQMINQQPKAIVQPVLMPTDVTNSIHIHSQSNVGVKQTMSAPICWQCRNPVVGKVVGCPSCGARYCGAETDTCKLSNLDTCLSCHSPASTFVTE
ncbi:MAG: CARDB domain-containing protein, partial [Candidatus Thermoplasmatota archaeon]|nr:CARDB domain-containing protein [Candidatus Thermoplasmatota archaeon]